MPAQQTGPIPLGSLRASHLLRRIFGSDPPPFSCLDNQPSAFRTTDGRKSSSRFWIGCCHFSVFTSGVLIGAHVGARSSKVTFRPPPVTSLSISHSGGETQFNATGGGGQPPATFDSHGAYRRTDPRIETDGYYTVLTSRRSPDSSGF